jgi:PLP dependent protein
MIVDGGNRDERLAENLARIRAGIAAACGRAGRDPAAVTILPATKYADIPTLEALVRLGFRTFGENHVQEAEEKARAIGDRAAFYLIGHLQRNKVKRALLLFRAIHSVDSVRLADEISRRLEPGRTLPLLIEVNVAGEEQKHGFPLAEALPALAAISAMPNLRVEGFMTVPPFAADPDAVRPHFRRLRELRDEARRRGLGDGTLDTLSMGMSNDFPVAVEEGATVVRIGSALFAERAP